MLFSTRTATNHHGTLSLDLLTESSIPFAPWNPPSFESSDEGASWEVLNAPTLPPSSPSDYSSFDTDTFPSQSYMFPSDRNGTQRTEIRRALLHPGETASSFNKALRRQTRSTDWSTLRDTVRSLAGSTSEGLNARLNQAFEGCDVPAMHDRMFSRGPSLSMPNLRPLEQAVDAVADAVQPLVRRGRSEARFLDQGLQGDQWAFARIMSARARDALVKQNICEEWQLIPNRANLCWHTRLNSTLAALFMNEKKSFGVTQLFEMSPCWAADVEKEVWRLELDTGVTDMVVDTESEEYSSSPIYLQVRFELPENYSCLRIADVERGVASAEEDWMAVK